MHSRGSRWESRPFWGKEVKCLPVMWEIKLGPVVGSVSFKKT